MAAFKEVPHGVADGLQAGAGIALGRKRVRCGRGSTACDVFLSAQAEEGSKQTRTAVGRPPARLSFGRSVLTVFARLGQRQCPVEPVVAIGIVAQPFGWRWQPARCERAGDGGLTSALRGMPPAGARGDLL